MANQSKGKKNQQPTGQGKKQSSRLGRNSEMEKRSEVLQAHRNRRELNLGTVEDLDAAGQVHEGKNPKRPKAGR